MVGRLPRSPSALCYSPPASFRILLYSFSCRSACGPVCWPTAQATAQPVQVAYARPVSSVPGFQPKIWLQIASGADDATLSSQFERLKSKNPDLFDGLQPYVARTAGGARLLVGPFRGRSDAETLAEDFETVGIQASNFTNSQADRIAPLAGE